MKLELVLINGGRVFMAFKYKEKYGNYINGKFIDPVDGKFFDNITPINGKV